jgi:hypothetical protein
MRKQKILVLYLANSALDSHTVAWAVYDGSGREKNPPEVDAPAPYPSVLAAMEDGWRVVQFPVMRRDEAGTEYKTDYLLHEFFLEKLEEVEDE